MTTRTLVRLFALLAVVALIAASCGGDSSTETDSGDGDENGGDASYTVHNVPADYASIQEGVDAAEPGDLVLIAPGTYEEAVVVQTDDIVIRGADRNEVVLDGGFQDENGFIIFSDGVAVENLTVRNFTGNGVFWTGDYDADHILDGYRASYVTAHNNGNYGIYAFNAANGIFEHSYGSGHPDSAFYIGQCDPCNAVLRDLLAENNTIGYSGTNSSGNLFVINSEWRHNRIGVLPNTLDSEELVPQHNIVVAGNLVYENDNAETPQKNDDWAIAFGNGIVVLGGNDNVVTKNTSVDNPVSNIAVFPSPFSTVFIPEGNHVIDNITSGAESAGDLVLVTSLDAPSTALGNCFAGNEFTTSEPEDIEAEAPCDGDGTGGADFVIDLATLQPGPDPISYEDVPAPDYTFESMPDAETAPPVPAVDLDVSVDVEAITAPAPPG